MPDEGKLIERNICCACGAKIRIVKHESEPVEISQDKTWQQQFEEKRDEAIADKKEPLAVLYYEEALKLPIPGPVWEQFKDSIYFQYWEPEHAEAAAKLNEQWVREVLKS